MSLRSIFLATLFLPQIVFSQSNPKRLVKPDSTLPDTMKFYSRDAIIADSLGDYARAIKDYTTQITLAPDDFDA